MKSAWEEAPQLVLPWQKAMISTFHGTGSRGPFACAKVSHENLSLIIFNKYFHIFVNFALDNLSQDDERHESSSVGSASSCDWGRGNSEKLDGSDSKD